MKPLEGVKVVELATMLAGPMCGRVLAEWGADVIKVESVNGDAWRIQYGTSLSPWTPKANPHFDIQNINKRFVCINMRTPEGQEIMEKLLSKSDVFLTNYREQALAGMGLSYDQVKKRFPRLVHAHVLGYGPEGPDKNRPGYDYTAFCARTGFLGDLAPAGGPPLMTIAGVGDHLVAMNLAGGISAALYERDKTGAGQRVECSLLSTGIFMLSMGIHNAFNGRVLPRNRFDCAHATSNTYKCSDEEWFYLAIVDYRKFPVLCDVIGHPELKDDERFVQKNFYTAESRKALTQIFDEIFAQKPVAYWHELLTKNDLPHEPIVHLKDVLYDPQVIANQYAFIHEYADGTKGANTTSPVRFSTVPKGSIPYRESRHRGADNEEILERLGYSPEQIAEFLEKNAIAKGDK